MGRIVLSGSNFSFVTSDSDANPGGGGSPGGGLNMQGEELFDCVSSLFRISDEVSGLLIAGRVNE